MTNERLPEYSEDRAKRMLVDEMVIASVTRFASNSVTTRKNRLLRMPLANLQWLAKAIETANSEQDMSLIVISAITAFEKISHAEIATVDDEPDSQK